MTAVLLTIAWSSGVQAASYPWLYEPWDSAKDKGAYREFRLKCDDLTWGLKTPVDIPDKKAMDAILNEKIAAYKKNKSADNAFYLLCAMTYFGPNTDAEVTLQLGEFIPKASGYRSYEFSRVAYAAYLLYHWPPLLKTDIQRRLFAARKSDPLVMLAAISVADFERGYTEVHRQALAYAQELYDTFPKRREKYRCILALTLEMCWFRSSWWAKKPLPEYYNRAMGLIAEAIADPQTSKVDRGSMESTKKFMIGIKSRVEGGG